MGQKTIPKLPPHSRVSRFPGMSNLCDKVNMALSLRLLQQLWPTTFTFWPQSWILPDDFPQLAIWMEEQHTEGEPANVIVKPSNGSLGGGIFIAQNSNDVSIKMSARTKEFSALAQQYVPSPLLLDGYKFDLRLYVLVTSVAPLEAYLCTEGLARFCTAAYQEPSPANLNDGNAHLTNYSLNKSNPDFIRDEDPFNPDTRACKRPLSTLLQQLSAQAEASGTEFDVEELWGSLEETAALLLQSLAPVLSISYTKAFEKPSCNKAKGGGDSDDSDDEAESRCFQILGMDVLLDLDLQPWLLELNGRPSMDIHEGTPEFMGQSSTSPAATELKVSEVDLYVKGIVMREAIGAVCSGEDGVNTEALAHYRAIDFDGLEPSPCQDALRAITDLYQEIDGAKGAFTTRGIRKVLRKAGDEHALNKRSFLTSVVDPLVGKWKHRDRVVYRQAEEIYYSPGGGTDDAPELGVLDFAELLLAVAQRHYAEEAPLDALCELLAAVGAM